MKKLLKVTYAGAIVVFTFVFETLGFIASVFDGDDEYGSSDNYEMSKVYNYKTGKFDNGYAPDGWYDDWR